MPPAPETTPPSSETIVAALVTKNLQLESKLVEIQTDYARAVDECLKVTVKLEEQQRNDFKKEPDDEKLMTGLENDLNSMIVEN